MQPTNVKTPYADKYIQSAINTEVKNNPGAKEYWKPTFREGRAKFVSLAKRRKSMIFAGKFQTGTTIPIIHKTR